MYLHRLDKNCHFVSRTTLNIRTKHSFNTRTLYVYKELERACQVFFKEAIMICVRILGG